MRIKDRKCCYNLGTDQMKLLSHWSAVLVSASSPRMFLKAGRIVLHPHPDRRNHSMQSRWAGGYTRADQTSIKEDMIHDAGLLIPQEI